MSKKVLLMGGTGAMGVYVAPRLIEMGYEVDVLSLDSVKSDVPGLRYLQGDAMQDDFLRPILANGYDAIIDFLIYHTARFPSRAELLLDSTDQMIYLSSYRVYADSTAPITEHSGRLLDVSPDEALRASDDYCIFKARGEDVLRASGKKNWTIVRPAVTFSKRRFQLVTLEANVVIERARSGKTVLLPETARTVEGTMTWAGDVARLMSRLVLNPRAMGETFTLSTAEHNPWGTIAEYYRDLIGLKYEWVDQEDFLRCIDPTGTNPAPRWQLEYDRLFRRVMDNRKVLEATGVKQEEFTSVYEGLRRELSALPRDVDWGETQINRNMDEYLRTRSK